MNPAHIAVLKVIIGPRQRAREGQIIFLVEHVDDNLTRGVMPSAFAPPRYSPYVQEVSSVNVGELSFPLKLNMTIPEEPDIPLLSPRPEVGGNGRLWLERVDDAEGEMVYGTRNRTEGKRMMGATGMRRVFKERGKKSCVRFCKL